MPENDHKIHSVEKAIALLDCFWRERRSLSLTELSAMTGWPKSSVHNLLSTMLTSAVVEQNPADGRYRLGMHLFEYGCVIAEQWDVVKLAKPHLHALMTRTGESTYLAAMNGSQLLIVDSAEPNNVFRVATKVGTRLPYHCSSQGKAILANMDTAAVKRILKRTGMKRYTLETIQSPEQYVAALEGVRRNGYAAEYEEYRSGMCSFAAPVFNHDGSCTCAVGIVCFLQSGGQKPDVSPATLKALKNTAEAVSTELGWHG